MKCPNCGGECKSCEVVCMFCFHIFRRVSETYSQDDEKARDREDATHFGFPHKNVFATVVNSAGYPTFSQKQHLTQLLGIRHFKKQDPDCWIWGERFIFAEREFPKNLDKQDQRNPETGYFWFLEKFEYEKRRQVEELVDRQKLRAELRPDTKTHGKPDLAIYSSRLDPEWRFVELKRSEKFDNSRQAKWLNLLSEALGPEAVYVLELEPA